jgi:HAE1 family hydrophobic/amphiphilic exporter-1
MFVIMPKGFMPTVDQGFLQGGSEGAQDASYDEMVHLMQQVNSIVGKNPWVQDYGSGTGGFGGQNQGFLFMALKSDPHRPPAQAVLGQLQAKLSQIPGLMVFLQIPPLIPLGQNENRAQYSVALQDPDTAELFKWAPVLEQKLHAIPQLQDVYSDLRLASPRLDVDIDRNRALAVGVTPDQIANTLYDAYGNRRVTTIQTSANQYDVILEVLPEDQRNPAALKDLYIRSSQGKMVPLAAVADLKQTVAPLSISHIGQLPAVNFQFNVKAGVSLSEATKLIDEAARQIGMPDTVTFSYTGTAAAFQSSIRGLGILLLIAVLVIYLVLGILYESFIHPITILSGLPAAGLGALLTLLLFGQDLNLYSFVGIILLIGIVKKNAIMMIDFALEAERKEGKPPEEAIFEGCMQRFRPIMMTTMAALLGTLPIAFGAGAGGEARRPLGIAVVGGLIVSQLLTLYITPVIYLYLDRFQSGRKKHRGGREQAVIVVPAEESLVS